MKKTIIIITLLFILSGCGNSNLPSEFEPHHGNDGLTVRFLDEAPPDEVYENTLFSVGLELQNKGAEDIENGKVVVVTERRLFNEFDNVFSISLKGKSQFDPEGEKQLKIIETETKNILASEKQESSVKINFCYPYKTLLSTEVCIDPDVLGEKQNKPSICPAKSVSFWDGQGAPVAVLELTTTMIPKENGVVPVFEFEIENVGNGKVVKKEAYEKACSSEGLKQNEIGQLNANTIYLGHEQLSCTKTKLKIEEVKEGNEFYDAQRTVMRCEGPLISYDNEAYIGSLTMTLEYGYQESIEKDFFILKSPTSLN